METKENLEKLACASFSLLNGMPSYFGLEQKSAIQFDPFSKLVEELLSKGLIHKLDRVSVHLKKEDEESFEMLSSFLISKGFEHFTSSVEYRLALTNFVKPSSNFQFLTLKDSYFTESEFKRLWQEVMFGSGNTTSTLSMDEHLDSIRNELGSEWESNCGVFYLDNHPVAVSIPHIEPGTSAEGRLFYFGLLPEARGKGYAAKLHYESLFLLKKMGASYYIGSTHETNKAMQRIFEKSGCTITGKKASYYYYFYKGDERHDN